jgi:hypothetical protein
MTTEHFVAYIRAIADLIEGGAATPHAAERAIWITEHANLRMLTRFLDASMVPTEWKDPATGEVTLTFRSVTPVDGSLLPANKRLLGLLTAIAQGATPPEAAAELRQYANRVQLILDCESLAAPLPVTSRASPSAGSGAHHDLAATADAESAPFQRTGEDDWYGAGWIEKQLSVPRWKILRAVQQGKLRFRGERRQRQISMSSFIAWHMASAGERPESEKSIRRKLGDE